MLRGVSSHPIKIWHDHYYYYFFFHLPNIYSLFGEGSLSSPSHRFTDKPQPYNCNPCSRWRFLDGWNWLCCVKCARIRWPASFKGGAVTSRNIRRAGRLREGGWEVGEKCVRACVRACVCANREGRDRGRAYLCSLGRNLFTQSHLHHCRSVVLSVWPGLKIKIFTYRL